jgi:hypothetical protein
VPVASRLIVARRAVGLNLPAFRESLRMIQSDPRRTYDYLLRVSMIASLRRAAELGRGSDQTRAQSGGVVQQGAKLRIPVLMNASFRAARSPNGGGEQCDEAAPNDDVASRQVMKQSEHWRSCDDCDLIE